MTLYSLRTALDDYRITKFDSDLNVESSYLLSPTLEQSGYECECPAGSRPSCRHRQMLPEMLSADICDTEWFYDFERKAVVDTNGNLRPKLTEQEITDLVDQINGSPYLQPHSPTATTPDFDSGDAGSTPAAVATKPATPWRRL